jgi:hypothetical protein
MQSKLKYALYVPLNLSENFALDVCGYVRRSKAVTCGFTQSFSGSCLSVLHHGLHLSVNHACHQQLVQCPRGIQESNLCMKDESYKTLQFPQLSDLSFDCYFLGPCLSYSPLCVSVSAFRWRGLPCAVYSGAKQEIDRIFTGAMGRPAR